MCISILKGYAPFFPHEEEIKTLKQEMEDDQTLSFLMHGIQSQLYIQCKNFEDSIKELDEAIGLMDIISIENTATIYGILLTILSLCTLFENEIICEIQSESSMGNGSAKFRNKSKTTECTKSLKDRRIEKLDRNVSFKGKDTVSSSLTHASSSIQRYFETSKSSDYGVAGLLHTYAGRMAKSLSGMPCHFLVQKLHILAKALEKRSDPQFVPLPLNYIKDEAKRLAQEKESKTKYLAIIFLVKNSKLYDKSEESRAMAEKICTENKIQTCLSIL